MLSYFLSKISSFLEVQLWAVLFCMADGSVHFINEQIDVWTYRKLSTRNGEEIVDKDAY